jgi:hypothetical protein
MLGLGSVARGSLDAELRAKRDGRSLTSYFSGRELPPSSAPASDAGNAEFSMT